VDVAARAAVTSTAQVGDFGIEALVRGRCLPGQSDLNGFYSAKQKNNGSMGTVAELLDCKLDGLSLKQAEVD